MKKELYNDGWCYWPEDDAFALVWKRSGSAAPVKLPHDAMLDKPAHADSVNKGNTGYRDGGVYYYSKDFYAAEEMKQETLLLFFEGVYMNAQVYVNAQLAGRWAYGYSGFYVKLNDFLEYGKNNEIRVIVRNSASPNSRWYSGSGIYRNVYLLTAPKCFIRPDGCLVRTVSVKDGRAEILVKTELVNDTAEERSGKISYEILDPDQKVVVKAGIPFILPVREENEDLIKKDPLARKQNSADQEKTVKDIVVEIPEPQLWEDTDPRLYTLKVAIESDDGSSDTWSETFGIRTMTLDARNGLVINGKSVKLKGACIHHDAGMLGARTFYDFHYRQVRILKSMGYNAIRMSHHPAAPELLQACDELGMYVMDETFDMWTRNKTANDYALYFTEWWERDVEAMVRKDYNHPSVILYSIGNEIPEIGTEAGARMASKISRKIKGLDESRFTLASINGLFAIGDHLLEVINDVLTPEEKATMTDPSGNVNDFMATMTHPREILAHPYMSERIQAAVKDLDIAGYNYMTERYPLDHEKNPDRVIVGSETYPGALAVNWQFVKKYPTIIGDFAWTGWDYLGESGIGVPSYGGAGDGFGTPYPCQMSYTGNVDITGFKKPVAYYTELIFGTRKDPYIATEDPIHYGERLNKTPWAFSAALATWTYPGSEGKTSRIEVYSAGDQVELFLNGKSLGKKPAGDAAGFVTVFEAPYEPGTLEAVSYEDGQEIGRHSLSTREGKQRLMVSVEKGRTGKLTFIDLELQDEKGNLVYNEYKDLKAEVEGNAAIYMGSGNHSPLMNFTESWTTTYHGRAQIIVVKDHPEDAVTVTVEGQKIQV